MTDIQVRRVRFDFAGEDVPFNWQPARPAFAMQCNLISFFAPGFEKFIVDATREAIPLIRDPEVAEEANVFLRPEAQHSAAHASHVRALARRWPGLRETMDEVTASFDHLRQPVSGVAFRVHGGHRSHVHAVLQGVPRSRGQTLRARRRTSCLLFLWHFVEEIEHRSSALKVYDAVHDSYLYRVKTIAGVVKHIDEILGIISRGFRKHVPESDGGGYGRLIPSGLSLRAFREAQRAAHELSARGQTTYAGVPRRELLAMLAGLVRSQGPHHDPALESLPAFAERWFDRFDEEAEECSPLVFNCQGRRIGLLPQLQWRYCPWP